MYDNIKCCELCPRKCKVNRHETVGFCQSKDKFKIARAALHMWEEPCLSGKNGSGAIFFSGCSLRCVFCQNKEISSKNFGKEVSSHELKEIMLKLQDEGANNINFVTPTHFSGMLIPVLKDIKHKLHIPIVYNTSGYETTDTIKSLDGLIDIYLPDFKYKSKFISKKLSGVSNYYENAISAISQMLDQTGKCVFDENGLLIKGTVIRHLVLPGFLDNSVAVLNEISKRFKNRGALVSIMSQYTPLFYNGNIQSLKRTLTQEEYDLIINYTVELKLQGFMQELNSANKKFTPSFNLEGLK